MTTQDVIIFCIFLIGGILSVAYYYHGGDS